MYVLDVSLIHLKNICPHQRGHSNTHFLHEKNENTKCSLYLFLLYNLSTRCHWGLYVVFQCSLLPDLVRERPHEAAADFKVMILKCKTESFSRSLAC